MSVALVTVREQGAYECPITFYWKMVLLDYKVRGREPQTRGNDTLFFFMHKIIIFMLGKYIGIKFTKCYYLYLILIKNK